MLENLKQKFEEKFGGQGDIRCYFAPGRVNLIGEHTDYNVVYASFEASIRAEEMIRRTLDTASY